MMKRATLFVLLPLLAPQFARAQNAQLMPVVRQQYLSNNGGILPNSVLYVYNAGSSTQAPTYQDPAATVLNANPILADSTGHLPPVFLLNQQYKFVWCQANDGPSACASGDILATQDNVAGFGAGGSGSASSPFISASSNPATTGILRCASGDACLSFRNAANNSNLTLTKDSNDLLSWSGGSLKLPEIAAPAGVAAFDLLWADNSHRWKFSNNGGAADVVVGATTTDTLTNKTLDTGGAGNALKIAGTQITAVTPAVGTVVGNTATTTINGTACTITSSCTVSAEATVGMTNLSSAQLINSGAFGPKYVLNVAHTLTRIYEWAYSGTSSCAGSATWAFYDFTAGSTVGSISVGNQSTGTAIDSGALSVAMTAGHVYGFNTTAATSGCSAGSLNLSATYQ